MTKQTTMTKETILDLIKLIERVDHERETALLTENRKDRGYPFACGYQQSALARIKQTLELHV